MPHLQQTPARALRIRRPKLLLGVRVARVLGPRRVAELARLGAAARSAAVLGWAAVYAFLDDGWDDAAVLALIVVAYVGIAGYYFGFDWLRAHIYY